jgi:hypothetical protein
MQETVRTDTPEIETNDPVYQITSRFDVNNLHTALLIVG